MIFLKALQNWIEILILFELEIGIFIIDSNSMELDTWRHQIYIGLIQLYVP